MSNSENQPCRALRDIEIRVEAEMRAFGSGVGRKNCKKKLTGAVRFFPSAPGSAGLSPLEVVRWNRPAARVEPASNVRASFGARPGCVIRARRKKRAPMDIGTNSGTETDGVMSRCARTEAETPPRPGSGAGIS